MFFLPTAKIYMKVRSAAGCEILQQGHIVLYNYYIINHIISLLLNTIPVPGLCIAYLTAVLISLF